MEERIRDAIEALVDMDDSGPCENLIRIKGVKTPVIAEAALEAEIFYPPILYRYAAPETRDKLIALLEQDDGGKANNYLVALAVIGDERVAECFKKWEEHPPAWQEKLYVGPSVYALEGGWFLEDGSQKPLTFDTCYALEPVDDCLAETNVFGGTSGLAFWGCGGESRSSTANAVCLGRNSSTADMRRTERARLFTMRAGRENLARTNP